MSYAVKLPVFEGPLDLLLHLVRGHKLNIWEIPIAEIAEQYQASVELMQAMDLEVGGEFLLMASTLMEIKSRMLLPRPEPTLFEDEGVDPRAELVARLLEYEQYKALAEKLQQLALESRQAFPRPAPEMWDGAPPLKEVMAADLVAALRRALESDDEEQNKLPRARVRREPFSLKQRMNELLRTLRLLRGPASLRSLTPPGRGLSHTRELVVLFMAVLELLKLGEIRAWQVEGATDILVEAIDPNSSPTEADLGAEVDVDTQPSRR